MTRHARTGAALAGLCLLALPTGEWPALHDVAWRASAWLDAAHSERRALPADARQELMRAQRLQGVAGQEALRDWQRTAELSLQRALAVTLPYAETLVFDGQELAWARTGAYSFKVVVPWPERLRIVTRRDEGARGGLIVDVFEAATTGLAGGVPAPSDPTSAPTSTGTSAATPPDAPVLIGSYGPEPLEHRVVPRQDPASGETLPGTLRILHVRVQPTPAAIGRFALRLDAQPALGFPVDTDARSPVRSRFGVARDGGRRRHHGIDIFAERGTAVLAAADGVIVRTGDSPRGGLHVWHRATDERGQRLGSLYYAHLDRVDVQPGSVVRRGDQLGTVGNTGNAITTPPHLHFGLYRRFAGPVDPLPLTGEARRSAPGATIESALPRWTSVLPRRANLRDSPDTSRAPLATLTSGELVRVDAILPGGRWARVSRGSAEDSAGWMATSVLGRPSAGEAIRAQGKLRAAPVIGAPLLDRLDDGTRVVPLGRFGDAVQVRTAEGVIGWLIADDPAS